MAIGAALFAQELLHPGAGPADVAVLEAGKGYQDSVNEHWRRLQKVVAEDVEIWDEVAATRDSSAYRRNILNNRECKITAFHRSVEEML